MRTTTWRICLLKCLIAVFACLSIVPKAALAQQDFSVPCFLEQPTPWADSVFKTLSEDEKIGQLFMVAAWSDKKNASYDSNGIDLLIDKYHIGGVIFFQGGPVRQALLTNRYQSRSRIPLLIGMDAEWGLGMRLDSTISFPRQLTLGALSDPSLVYDFGREMAREMKRLGVQVSFSPVVDVNSNPHNPVISNRSFGEDPDLVTRFSLAYMKGLQDGGILASAKHFPGHGDTEADSHKELPSVLHSRARLDSVELAPYRSLITEGLASVMVAHLYVPELDSTPNLPSTLSVPIVQGVLRNDLKFKGLVFTDAMNMQGVAKYYAPGMADVQALVAGNDVILYPGNIPVAVEQIHSAIAGGTLSWSDIDQKVLRILRAKEWAGLSDLDPVNPRDLVADLVTPEAQVLNRQLVEQSITILRNNCNILPVTLEPGIRIAVVSVGEEKDNAFTEMLARYFAFDAFSMEKNPDFAASILWHDTLSTYDLVIAPMLNTSNRPSKNFGISNEAGRILNAVGANTNLVLGVFANPYSFQVLKELQNVEAVVMAYQDDAITRQVCAEIIAGAVTANGSLAVTASESFAFAAGLCLKDPVRLRWVEPAYAGFTGGNTGLRVAGKNDSITGGNPAGDYEEDMMEDKNSAVYTRDISSFGRIDSIALSGIQRGAYPGCRVLIAQNGMVLYDRSFGTLDWHSRAPVDESTIYDLASVTKLASSTLAVMKLVDEGKLDVEKTLGEYLDIPEGNPYRTIPIQAMLSHTAGFTPWIPFFQKTLNNGFPDKAIFSSEEDSIHTRVVADSLFILDTYRDTMFNEILQAPLNPGQGYKYSDLGYYFIQRIVEKLTGTTLDEYVSTSFYEPMGLQTMMYCPLRKFSSERIAPTEDDTVFRHQLIRGYVHDQGAAMMGGVAGHAGLFATAQDLAAIMQMLLNKGSYGGHVFISEKTIDYFNTRHYPGNRRGLGFDKPALAANSGSTCAEASDSSFGHTGFTGTMCWADPANGTVYVFLSNRVNPDAENKRLQDLNIRTEIQREMYRVLGQKR